MLENKLDELIEVLGEIAQGVNDNKGEMYRNTPADSLEAIAGTMEHILETLQNIESKLK